MPIREGKCCSCGARHSDEDSQLYPANGQLFQVNGDFVHVNVCAHCGKLYIGLLPKIARPATGFDPMPTFVDADDMWAELGDEKNEPRANPENLHRFQEMTGSPVYAPQILKTVLSFGLRPFKWGQEQTLMIMSERAGLATKLFIHNSVAPFYRILSIQIDNIEALTGPAPAEIFNPLFDEAPGSLAIQFKAGAQFTIRAQAVRPRTPQSFTAAWWCHWFTREGWRKHIKRMPPQFTAALLVSTIVDNEERT
jgi:hypothetical protein